MSNAESQWQPSIPGDDAYETGRIPWNLAADQHPAAVTTAGTPEQAGQAVRWAAGSGMKVACQTTGHMAAVMPDLADTLLLRLDLTDRIEVDHDNLTARIPAGAKWSDVVEEIAPLGLAAMHGSSPSVGVIGYLLGGGLSFYGRAKGFAANHVRSVDVLTAAGELVTAAPDQNDDLFWALRGAGGRFGVVTGIQISLMDLAEVFAGATFWPASMAPEVLLAWRDWTREAPRSVTTTCRILRLPPLEEVPEPLRGTPVVCVDGVALDHDAGEELAAILDGCGEALMGGWEVMPTPAISRLHGDPEDPLPAAGDSILLSDLDDTGIESFIEAAGETSDSSLVVAELRHLGGALAEPPDGAGALAAVDAEYLLFGTGIADPGSAARTEADLERLLSALRPAKAPRKLYGFAESGCSLSECFEPDTVARLRAVKERYDPEGRFVAPQVLD
jgi:FAD/FMN-containing dehydrogenase